MKNRNRLYTLLQAIQEHAEFDHPVKELRIKETHISCVLLTGDYVYKFKKPVDFGFIDFTTLEKRKFYCEEELRLNRRLAPELYLGVVTISGNENQPVIGGTGQVLEYAVKMRQFPEGAELDTVLPSGKCSAAVIEELAERVAAFHQRVDITPPESPYGSFEYTRKTVLENISQLSSLIATDKQSSKWLNELKAWTMNALMDLEDIFTSRKQLGYIRECHGDLHLRNIALSDKSLIIFDCIEFSEDLRWIDVINEIAFLIMDFEAHDNAALGQRFLNSYMEHTGDYEGLSLLRFYCIYRALVLAKVTCLQIGQAGFGHDKSQLIDKYRRYIDLARNYIKPVDKFLIITHGVSGSGKTTHTQPLLEMLPAIRIRSDVERKRLSEIDPDEHSRSELMGGIYTENTSNYVYDYLARLAGIIISAGYSVIIDATFLKRNYRKKIYELAVQLRSSFIILSFHANRENLQQRIRQRTISGKTVSEADESVLNYQLTNQDPLEKEETSMCIKLNTNQKIDYAQMIDEIHKHTGTKANERGHCDDYENVDPGQ